MTMIELKRMSQWGLIACLLVVGGRVMGEEALHMPSSWQELVAFRMAKGDLGEWKGTGVTTGIWAGIPAGLDYEISETVEWSADRTKLLNSHQFKTKAGEILSTGAGFVTFDARRGGFYSSGSGYDGGKLYTGFSRLVGLKGDREVWTYTESIGGKTYTVRRTTRWVSDTEKVVTHEREGDSSTADVMRMTKVVKGRGKVASSSLQDFYEFCDLFEGRWMRDVILIADWPGVGLSRGEQLTGYDSFTKQLDGELLQWRSSVGESDFTAIFHWDSGSSTIQFTAYNSSGAMHHATGWKVGEGHYTFNLDRAFERDGRRLKGQINFVFEKDGRVIRFQGNGLKLGGEKLDPLRDVFRKISK